MPPLPAEVYPMERPGPVLPCVFASCGRLRLSRASLVFLAALSSQREVVFDEQTAVFVISLPVPLDYYFFTSPVPFFPPCNAAFLPFARREKNIPLSLQDPLLTFMRRIHGGSQWTWVHVHFPHLGDAVARDALS